MKMRKKTLLSIVFLVIVATLFALGYKASFSIDRVLESEAYSYLPKNAKNYIKKYYEDTNQVLLTEKNKKENTPYLNPRYIDYLALDTKKQQETGDIPDVFTIDYVAEESTDTYPSKYDLRNVSGNNYLTPLKDQGDLNLCWSYTTTEQVESLLMLKSNKPYNSSSEILSTSQMDYATSSDGIKDYVNENRNRVFGEGGNFYIASVAASNAISLIPESKMPQTTSTEQKELVDVLNYGNSLYEVDSSVALPRFSGDYNSSEFQSYNNLIKKAIVENGGLYIGTQAPGYECSSRNNDNKYIIRVDDSCLKESGHALQVIGWDDNYEYTYCVDGNKHKPSTACSASDRITGTGAWLLRNSWGNNFSYVYLAYDSLNSDFGYIREVSDMRTKNWDNNYHKTLDKLLRQYEYFNTDSKSFTKNINTVEKVQKVKFFALGQNGTYTISIISDKEVYNNIKTINTDLPGIYTIDLSDKNILLTDSTFYVNISSTNNADLMIDSMSIFTKNVDSVPIIKTEGTFQRDLSNSDYLFRIYSNTKGIPSNSTINYSLYDELNNNVSDYLSVSYNKVAKNDTNTIVIIDKDIEEGKYILRANYNSASEDIPITIGDPNHIKVYYYANDGTNISIHQIVPKNESFSLQINTFNRTGYKFVNWNTKSDGNGNTYLDNSNMSGLEKSLKLFAIWEPITYTLKFNSNGGTGTMNNQTMTYNVSNKLHKMNFSRDEYSFVSWNTKSDGSGTNYTDEQVVKNLTTTDGKVIELFAIWKKDLSINPDDYSIDEENNYIDDIGYNTDISTFISKLSLKTGYTVEVDIDNKNYIYTGSKTKIYKNSELVDEFTNIVRGDVNGDGKISALDYVRIKNHIMRSSMITNEYEKVAADANKDDMISALDYVKIRLIIMGGG